MSTPHLMPVGVHDVLPNAASRLRGVESLLLNQWEAAGFALTYPAFLEFEQPGATHTAPAFRLLDPLSLNPMRVRSDITPQVARIAASSTVPE
jgi:ATP phosphoribosyltransferase regulatory subunit